MARRQRKRVPPAIIPGPSDQSATPQPTAAVPWGWETDGREIPPPGRRFFSSGVQPPQPWQDQADTPLPLKVSEEQETAYHRGWREPPNLPPSDLDTAGASQPDPSATFAGGGAFSADGILAASAEQRPAAYRFELRGGKIDILPEPPEPEDRGFALDTYQDLVAKARELHERLKGTNSARRVCNSVERLLTALGTRFDALRPGVLLSRSRSLEADRAAFGDELLPDTIAMMDDAARTLRDLLASFPTVRRIEAEVLALDLDRSADAVPTIREQMAAIKAAAIRSGAVTEEVISALAQNDDAIEEATDPLVRTSLVADKLLVFRNFVGAVIGGLASYGSIAIAKARAGLGELAGKSWEEVKNQLPKSIGATAALVPPFALVGLVVWFTDPVTGVAVTVATFKPMAKILKSFARDEKTKKQPKRGKNR
jgi:hypothetical protein